MLLPLNDRNIYYDIVGPESGPVVCFAHSLAADSGMWAEQLPALLAAGYRVLRIDMRGHGGSTALPGNYTIDELADDVIAITDSLDVKQFHFVGLSIGGMFGQSLGIRHGARTNSLVLCDTQPASPPDAQARWNPRIEAVLKANSMLPLADSTIGRWLTEDYQQRNPGRWKQIHETIKATTPQGYIGCSRAIQNFDFRAKLITITAPTIIVYGGDDPAAPPAESKHTASLFANARCEEISGARHLPNVEMPELFNRLLLDWLQTHR